MVFRRVLLWDRYSFLYTLTLNKIASSILFADDTSIIISNANPEEFKTSINTVMTEITNWFQSNLLTLNFMYAPLWFRIHKGLIRHVI